MKKKIIIFSIITVALLVIVSLSNVVGYNTIKTSQEELIESEYSFDECKDYLFETLVEISENPEIKDIIKSNYKPQRTMLPFRRSNVELKVEHLELLYNFGLKIMDRLGEDKVEELMENIEINNEMFEQVEPIIMGNDELRERIYTLNEMNSEEVSILGEDDFPIICVILEILMNVAYFILEVIIITISNIIPFNIISFCITFYLVFPIFLFIIFPLEALLWVFCSDV